MTGAQIAAASRTQRSVIPRRRRGEAAASGITSTAQMIIR